METAPGPLLRPTSVTGNHDVPGWTGARFSNGTGSPLVPFLLSFRAGT